MKRVVPIILLIALIVLPIGGGLFYWYEYRPAEIRRECSWVRKTSEAKPGRASMTEEELREKGMLNDCSKVKNPTWLTGYGESFCNDTNWKLIQEYKNPIPDMPAKEWWEESTRYEYEFCIKSRGLQQ